VYIRVITKKITNDTEALGGELDDELGEGDGDEDIV
jgi:hypothetical protein